MASNLKTIHSTWMPGQFRWAAFGRTAVIGFALVLSPGMVWGQGPKLATGKGTPDATLSPADRGRKLLNEAFAKSQVAKTVDDASEILEQCERAESLSLNAANFTYAQKLKAWAHNRRGEIYAEQASQLVKEGEVREANDLDAVALEDFSAALKLDETKWVAYHNRGFHLALFGRHEEALADYTKAIELQEKFTKAWLDRGSLRWSLGQEEAALADFSQAIKLAPQDGDAWLRRAQANLTLGKFPAALADINQTLRVQPNHALAYALRGEASLGMGSWHNAANDFGQAIRLNPKLVRGYRGAAWILATCPEASVRKADTALAYAKKAIELSPKKEAKLYDILAAAQANAGQFDEARETLTQALEMASREQVDELTLRLANYLDLKPFRLSPPAENARANVTAR